MIAVCGIPSDPPTALVIAALERMGFPHVVLHQRRFQDTSVDVEISGGEIRGLLFDGPGHPPVDCSQVTGVYTRLMDWRLLPEVREGSEETAQRCQVWHDALNNWTEIASGCVMNRATASASNRSKPYQSQLIRQAGFSVPDTLVTNDPDFVRDFKARHGRLIYKSISSVRSIVHELDDEATRRLPLIRGCPVQFQRYVPGTNVRVHVVAQNVFATRVDTDQVDYRYVQEEGGRTEFSTWELPDDLAERCRKLASGLGLALAGVDLILTDDGEAYCLEVNPSPGFSCYESRTAQPISDAVALALQRG
ncbi:ATP-grasp domain-containing protein [Streptomyces sp. NPDC058751]|uniref:ATP-grasp domain-containing protein n=1 Tax=Streptomyces sp. NPDC058751 TaxID=3346623 RepID=UPI003693099B